MHEYRKDENVSLPLQAVHHTRHAPYLGLHFFDTAVSGIATGSNSPPLAMSIYLIAVMNDLDESCSIHSPTSMS